MYEILTDNNTARAVALYLDSAAAVYSMHRTGGGYLFTVTACESFAALDRFIDSL